MSFSHWLDRIQARIKNSSRGKVTQKRRSKALKRHEWITPLTESLEDRVLLSAITVDTTTDEVGGDTSSIANLIATPGGTGISLREAIIAANNTAGADTINLPPGLYQLTITGAAENASATGDLDILDTTTIQSTVVGVNAIIDGNGTDRVLHTVSGDILTGGAAASLTLNDITIQNGTTSSNSLTNGFGGGGISHLEGDLNLNRVVVQNNSTTGTSADGGGLNVDFDDTENNFTITIIDSTFDNNTTGDRGGGLYFDADGHADGGQFTVNIINSTISNNTAFDDAGGLWNTGGDVEYLFNITNTTISGNTATTDLGGGIGAFGTATWNINNSTIVGNTAGDTGGGLDLSSGVVRLNSTIVAGNTASIAADGFDIFGTITSTAGHNLIGITDGATVGGITTGNLTGTFASPLSPNLGVLRDNGGPTQTHAPNGGSIVIDAGDNTSLSLTADQRSYTTREDGADADIGAFETDAVDPDPNAAPLSAGDIVVLGWASDGADDEFAVMPLVDLTAGDVIYFTDRGWDNANNRFVNATEEASQFTIAYTVPGGGILAGDVLDDVDLGIDISNFGSEILDTDGDQLLIYQTSGPLAAPTLIYGFNMNLAAANTAGWSTATGPLDTQQTNLPPGGTAVTAAGQTNNAFGWAFQNGSEIDNAKYTGAITSADKATWLARVNNVANWTKDDVNPIDVTSSTFNGGTLPVGGVSNTAPAIAVGNLSYTEGDNSGNPVVIDSGATASDTEGNWDGGSLTIQITANNEATDEISIGAVGNITVNPTNGEISSSGTHFATATDIDATVTDGTLLTINFDAMAGNATDARIQELVRAASYRTTSDTPGTTARTVTFTLSDDTDSTVDTSTVSVADAAEEVNLSVDVSTGTEAAGTVVTVTATASGNVTGAQTVNIAASGTGITAGDGTLSAATISIADGASSGFVTFTILNDAVVEALMETATLTISNPSVGVTIGATNTQNVTITDNDSATLTIDDVTQAETDAGTTAFTFTVTLDAEVDTGVSFDFATANNTATTADGDYTGLATTTRNFASTAAGATETITVQVNGDQKVELDETFFVNLASIAAGGRDVTFSAGGDQGQGTITNDDAATLTIDDVTQAETDAGTMAVTFTVTLDTEVDTGVSFDFATANDTATTADADYTGISTTTRNFASTAAGATETITVQVNGDQKVELDETFFVNLASIAAGGRDVTFSAGGDQGQGTITNDDAATLTIDDVTQAETDAGTTAFTFTVTLDAEVDTGVSFDFATANNTATTADGDYTGLATTTRNFASTAAGATETITVQVNGDQKVELDETFFTNLSGISAGGRDVTFADSQGLGTITNDDAATLTIDDVTQDEGNAGPTLFTFTVTLDAEVDTGVSFDFETSSGTATITDNDYATVSLTTRNYASTAAGSTESVTVQVNGDTKFEADETFFLDLSNLLAGGRDVTFSAGGDQGLGTITNDDNSLDPMIDGGGNLVVDESGGNTIDVLTISSDGTNVILSDATNPLGTGGIAGATGDGTNTITIPLASFTGGVIVNSLGNDDSLTVDFGGGANFGREVTFNGGSTMQTGGDELFLQGGGTFALADFTFDNLNDGSINVTGNQTISYTGLEPITSTISATNVTLNYSTTAETIDVTPGPAGQTTVDSDAGEIVTFNNPSTLLTINPGATGGNTINVEGVGSGFNAGLTINNNGAADALTFQNTSTNTGAGDVNITSTSIAVNQTVQTSGTITLNATNNISDNGNGLLDAPTVDLTAGGMIGTLANNQNTDTDNLTTDTSGGNGNQWINEADGLSDIDVGAGNGNVFLTAGGAITDGAADGTDISAAGALISANGVGQGINFLETTLTNLEANSGTGGLWVSNTGSSLTVGGVDGGVTGITANGNISVYTGTAINDDLIVNEAIDSNGGNVEVRASNDVVVNADINSDDGDITLTSNTDAADGGAVTVAAGTVDSGAGNITLTANDDAAMGNNVEVSAGATLQTTGGDIDLQSGDDVLLPTGSTVSAGGQLRIAADFADADGGVGAQLTLEGTLSTVMQGQILGGADNDTFTLNPDSTTGSLLLDGQGGDDSYDVQFGNLGGQVDIDDQAAEGTDELTLRGSAMPNVFTIGAAQTTLGGQTVTYTANLEAITVRGEDGDDTFDVTPSTTATMNLLGGNPTTAPGDTVNFMTPSGETFTLTPDGADGGTFSTTGGFQDVIFDEIESLAFAGDMLTVNGSAQDDLFDLTLTGADSGTLDFTGDVDGVPGPTFMVSIGFSGLEQLIANGGDGDDVFRQNNTGGPLGLLSGVEFNGGMGSDTLEVLGGMATDVLHTFTNASDGSITIDAFGLTYTGLEPILDTITATTRTFTFAGTDDDITLSDLGGGMSRIESVSSSETVDFLNPTGSLTVNAGDGADTLDASASAVAVTINGGGGADEITGTSLADAINGDAGNDQITGGVGNDVIDGGADDDLLIWNNGDGSDMMDGGADTDELEVNGSTVMPAGDTIAISANGTRFDLARADGGAGLGPFTLDVGTIETLDLNTLDGDDSVAVNDLTGVADLATLTIEVGAGNDTVDASALPNLGQSLMIEGGDDDDTLTGSAGPSIVNGNMGNDSLIGGAADDTMMGGGGDDVIDGAAGADMLSGQAGDDTLTGGLGDDTLNGGADTDQIIETGDTDFDLGDTSLVSPLTGTDVVTDVEEAMLTGGAGTNTIDAADFSGTSTLMGGDNDDTITGAMGASAINGNMGNDELTGLGAADTIMGGGGADLMDGGAGGDMLTGQAGDDTMTGGLGDDTLNGGADTDRIVESGDTDFDLGDATLVSPLFGTDTLMDVEEADLNGGASANTIDASDFSGVATLMGGDNDDTITGAMGASAINGNMGNDELTGLGAADTIMGGGGDDLIDGGAGGDMLTGQAGDDTMTGGLGDDTLNGGADTDLIVESGDTDFDLGDASLVSPLLGTDTLMDVEEADLTGGASANTIDASDFSGVATLTGGDSDDTITGAMGSSMINGNMGNDSLLGLGATDGIMGGGGNDFIDGGDGADTLTGQANDDTIIGGLGNDMIMGGDDNDLINGSLGNDTISGDAGDDRIQGSNLSDYPGNPQMPIADLNTINMTDQDSLLGGSGADTIAGAIGADFIDGEGDADIIDAQSGGDTTDGIDTIVGGAGDIIFRDPEDTVL